MRCGIYDTVMLGSLLLSRFLAIFLTYFRRQNDNVLKNQCYYYLFCIFSSILCQYGTIFAKNFGERIFKITTCAPACGGDGGYDARQTMPQICKKLIYFNLLLT
jgi:hypothetical protein